MTNIIIPKKRGLIVPDRLKGHRSEVAGFFTLRLGKMQPDGTVAYNREYSFPNIITNQGLDRMGNNAHYATYCQVGTGTTPPAATDTALVAPVGAGGSVTSTGGGNAQGIVIGPPRYAYDRRVHRLAAGVGTGNLAELGIGWAAGTGATLYNRALILDGSGNPITITKLADEILDVTYELRTYIPTSDITGTIVISGNSYDYIIRAAEADQIKPAFDAGWGPQVSSGTIYQWSSVILAANQGNAAFTGNINTIDGQPGTAAGVTCSPSSSAYTPGTLERVIKHTYGLGGSPIRSILYSFGWGSYQIQFDPVIPKGAGNSFEVEFIHSWARRTI